MHVSLFQVNIALRCFLHSHDNIAKEGTDLMPYSYLTDFTAHSMPLNSLEHCIGTTSMTNIRPDEDLNPVEFRAIAGSNVPSRPPRYFKHKQTYSGSY